MRSLSFDLRGKVQALRTALYTSYIEDVLRIPVCLVHDFAMPAEDIICFRVPKPYPHVDGMEKRFYSTLSFYNKGCDFFLRLDGYSEVQETGLDKNDCRENAAQFLPVTMHISSIDYVEAAHHANAGGLRVHRPARATLKKLWAQMHSILKIPMSTS